MADYVGYLIPQDDIFREAFKIATSNGPVARYMLRAIEEKLEPSGEWVAQTDAEIVDLEHVLPQNPSKAWGMTREEADELYPRIGNLAILPKALNARLGNSGWPEKRRPSKTLDISTQNGLQPRQSGRQRRLRSGRPYLPMKLSKPGR